MKSVWRKRKIFSLSDTTRTNRGFDTGQVRRVEKGFAVYPLSRKPPLGGSVSNGH